MPIHFIKTKNPTTGEEELINLLNDSLRTQKVLWLLSGGSNIEIEVRVMRSIADALTSNLLLLLVDERYGIEGHKDSNYVQLLSSGFDKKQSAFESILDDHLSVEQITDHFTKLFIDYRNSADIIIGQLGIGGDGHTAGILPYSPKLSSLSPVVYYESQPFNRLSLSLTALKSIDVAFVFCYGDSKYSALSSLRSGDKSIDELPCQIFSTIKDVKVYNDQIEGEPE